MNSAEESAGLPKETGSGQAAPSKSTPAMPSDPLSTARQRVRDGWLYVLLGALTLVAAVVCFFSILGRDRGDGYVERHTAFVVASSAMAVFFVLATWQFVRARWVGLKTRGLTVGLWLMALCDIYLMVCFVKLVDCGCERVRFPALAAILALGLALALGVWVANEPRPEPPSRRRKAAFVSILAVLFLAVSIPIAGMIGALFDCPISGRPWPSYLPEWMRSPVAAVTVRAWPATRSQWIRMGTAPLWLIREEASEPWNRDAWHWWALRAPDEALAEALDVSPTLSPLASTTRDNIAGYIVGKLGSEKDILERIRGPYSYELKNGIYDGIAGIDSVTGVRREVSREVIEALIDYLISASDTYPVQILTPLKRYPDLLRKLVDHWPKTPSRLGLSNLHLHSLWMGTDEDHQILLEALDSPDFRVRGVALYQAHRRFTCGRGNLPSFIVGRLIEIAAGGRPDVFPDEREYAANMLLSNTRGGIPESWFESVPASGPNASPLNKARERWIQEAVRLARE